MSGDPILDAATVADMLAAIDTVYGLDLPTSVTPGTKLAEMWAAAIAVTKDPRPHVLYEAVGKEPIELPLLPATVRLRLHDTDTDTTPPAGEGP